MSIKKVDFCQNDSPMVESFWQNNSLVTHILFELQSIIILSPVANFDDQSLAQLLSDENFFIATNFWDLL